MPRLKTSHFAKAKKPVVRDYVMDMLNAYQRGREMKREELAAKMGIYPTTLSKKKARGSKELTLEEFKQWVKLLDIPEESAANAVYMYLTQ